MALGTAAGLTEMEDDLQGLQAMWGAYEGQTLIGAVALGHHDGLDLVGWLAVDAGWRGRGLGARLLAELEREALTRGVGRLWATAAHRGSSCATDTRRATRGQSTKSCSGAAAAASSTARRARRRRCARA